MSIGAIQRQPLHQGKPFHYVNGGEAFGSESYAGVRLPGLQINGCPKSYTSYQIVDSAYRARVLKNRTNNQKRVREVTRWSKTWNQLEAQLFHLPRLSCQDLLNWSSRPAKVSFPPIIASSQLDLNCHTPNCVLKSAPTRMIVFSGRKVFRILIVVVGSTRQTILGILGQLLKLGLILDVHHSWTV
jgi:hypothetical protein